MTHAILVVGEDPQIERLLRASLAQIGYLVFVAHNSKAVRQDYAKGAPL